MRRVTISIMRRPTLGTRPCSDVEATQSTRAAACEAVRARDTRPGFIDFAVGHAKPYGFVGKHGAKLAPSGIVDGFRHTGLTEFGTGDIAHDNQAGPLDNGRGDFMRPILAGVSDTSMDGGDAALLMGTAAPVPRRLHTAASGWRGSMGWACPSTPVGSSAPGQSRSLPHRAGHQARQPRTGD